MSFRRRGTVANVVRNAFDSIVTLMFPSDCRLCGLPLASSSRLPVCSDCLASIEPISGYRCLLCGEHLFNGYAQSLCGECLTQRPPFAKASAYGSYEGGLRELIHLLKYEQVRPAADVLGRMLAEAVLDLAPDIESMGAPFKPSVGLSGVVKEDSGEVIDSLLVIPVPLHATKLHQRGFNQSELIAKAMLKHKILGLNLELAPELLLRTRPTQSQVGYTRQQRIANLRGAFRADDAVNGCNILLVDDVFTTGTTVSECARVLRRAGAEKVWVATIARVLKSVAAFAPFRSDEEERALAAHA